MDIMNGIKIFHYFRITVGQGPCYNAGVPVPPGFLLPCYNTLTHALYPMYIYVHTYTLYFLC